MLHRARKGDNQLNHVSRGQEKVGRREKVLKLEKNTFNDSPIRLLQEMNKYQS